MPFDGSVSGDSSGVGTNHARAFPRVLEGSRTCAFATGYSLTLLLCAVQLSRSVARGSGGASLHRHRFGHQWPPRVVPTVARGI